MTVSSSIVVNGVARTVPLEWSVAQLLSDVGMPTERVAVEINQRIIDRQEYATRRLKSGDSIEIIMFVGGGAWGR